MLWYPIFLRLEKLLKHHLVYWGDCFHLLFLCQILRIKTIGGIEASLVVQQQIFWYFLPDSSRKTCRPMYIKSSNKDANTRQPTLLVVRLFVTKTYKCYNFCFIKLSVASFNHSLPKWLHVLLWIYTRCCKTQLKQTNLNEYSQTEWYWYGRKSINSRRNIFQWQSRKELRIDFFPSLITKIVTISIINASYVL